MTNRINAIRYFSQLQNLLDENKDLLENGDTEFIDSLFQVWDERILSKKLINLCLKYEAEKLDEINPNQTKLEICKTIYWILMPLEESHTSIEDNYRCILP